VKEDEVGESDKEHANEDEGHYAKDEINHIVRISQAATGKHDDHTNQRYYRYDKCHQQSDPGVADQLEKVLAVEESHAVAEPWTVVIHVKHALATS